MTAADVIRYLKRYARPEKAKHALRFFKTGKGQYGEGDQFLGLTNPGIHSVVKEFKNTPLNEVGLLIKNPFHEVRVAAVLILVAQYQKANDERKLQIFNLYCQSFKYINNWDIVDLSAPKITGDYILNHPELTNKITTWTQSNHLWTRRIGVMSTFAFIRNNQFEIATNVCQKLLNDQEDLIHKATGWMLREIGKRDEKVLLTFLSQHAKTMPRTMLRYAIEKLTPTQREHYLAK